MVKLSTPLITSFLFLSTFFVLLIWRLAEKLISIPNLDNVINIYYRRLIAAVFFFIISNFMILTSYALLYNSLIQDRILSKYFSLQLIFSTISALFLDIYILVLWLELGSYYTQLALYAFFMFFFAVNIANIMALLQYWKIIFDYNTREVPIDIKNYVLNTYYFKIIYSILFGSVLLCGFIFYVLCSISQNLVSCNSLITGTIALFELVGMFMIGVLYLVWAIDFYTIESHNIIPRNTLSDLQNISSSYLRSLN